LLRRTLTEQGFDSKAANDAIDAARSAKRTNPELDVGEEALRLLHARKGGRHTANVLDDDNPYNDGVKYWPFRGFAFPPSDYKGPADRRQTDDVHARLDLAFVYGYRGDRVRSNLFYTASGKLVYHTAAVGIVYDKAAHTQARDGRCCRCRCARRGAPAKRVADGSASVGRSAPRTLAPSDARARSRPNPPASRVTASRSPSSTGTTTTSSRWRCTRTACFAPPARSSRSAPPRRAS
jgi:hypothetical protein